MMINADAIQWAKEYEGELYHALICDPPYHLTTITDRFGKEGVAPAKEGTDGAFKRLSTGFMGQVWDGGDIAFQKSTWEAFKRILHPGAFGMAFGGSRTAHRMAVAIEDAGFIIHPQMSWVYGSGFPKATRIDKQIDRNAPRKHLFAEFAKHFSEQWKKSGNGYDKLIDYFPHYKNSESINAQFRNWRLGKNVPTLLDFNILQPLLDLSLDYLPLIERIEAEREIVGEATDGAGNTGEETVKFMAPDSKVYDITVPATDLAKQWEGHRYGLQALKPASEPIIVFQKPYEGRPIDCITETGAGALNIDGGRIGIDHNEPNIRNNESRGGKSRGIWQQADIGRNATLQTGRWPANVLFTHSPDCEAIGYRDSDSYQINRFTDGAKPFGDAVGEKFESEEVEGGRVPVWECVEGCPVLALDKQSGKLTSGTGAVKKATSAGHQGNVYGSDSRPEGTPNIEYGDSGGASRFFHQSHWAIENADPFVYQAKVSVSERNAGLGNQVHDIGHNTRDVCANCGGRIFQNKDRPSACNCDNQKRVHEKVRNPHPTLKPIALVEHLATLLLPPKEYAPRRIFVPFAGVASEMIGCWRAGWEEITGIEMMPEYAEIGKARLEYWKKQGVQLDLFKESE